MIAFRLFFRAEDSRDTVSDQLESSAKEHQLVICLSFAPSAGFVEAAERWQSQYAMEPRTGGRCK
jgi:hypothetical protein